MRPLKPFDYFEPATLEEATTLLSKYGDRAAVLAGGVDLIPRMRKERITAQFLVPAQREKNPPVTKTAFLRKALTLFSFYRGIMEVLLFGGSRFAGDERILHNSLSQIGRAIRRKG